MVHTSENSKEGGFLVKYLIIAVAILALLKYFFDWSIIDAVSSEAGRSTIAYVRSVLDFIWFYLAGPVDYVWNEVIRPILEWAVSGFKKSS